MTDSYRAQNTSSYLTAPCRTAIECCYLRGKYDAAMSEHRGSFDFVLRKLEIGGQWMTDLEYLAYVDGITGDRLHDRSHWRRIGTSRHYVCDNHAP